jgi:hypothetical protein
MAAPSTSLKIMGKTMGTRSLASKEFGAQVCLEPFLPSTPLCDQLLLVSLVQS